MKLTKRIICTILTMVFALSSLYIPSTAATFADLPEDHSSYEAVTVLNQLGIINGYEEEGGLNFKPDNNVTRAEFTAMLLRTRGMGSVGSTSLENPPFPDVTTPDVSWAIANIRTARELKIINGYDDGTFKPNNNVSYEEAIKMIVCALGYGELGAEGTFWYSKYLMTAQSLGFTDGAGGAISTPATRATIAKMLYNCLEVKLAENNQITEKTILENDLKLTKNVGYISANPEVNLFSPEANLREDELQITLLNGTNSTSTYKVGDLSKYKDMLGAQIEFYYKDDFNSGLKTLLLATVKNSTTITIDAESIQNASASNISYLKTEDAQRETSITISPSSVVVYNGKLYGTSNDATSTFATYYGAEGIPMLGKLELIDRNGDNSFDVVFVYDYEPYFVSSVTTSDYKITDNALRKDISGGQNQVVINYKADDIKFVTPSGDNSSFSAIKKGSVIFVAKSKHASSLTTVVVCNDTVSGKITATSSSKGVTINGKNYKFSRLAPWKNKIGDANPAIVTAPSMGDTAKFYLDMNGDIIWYDKTEAASNQQYGYVTYAAYETEDFEDSAKVMIITKSSASGTVYTITNKTKLNGVVPVSLAAFVEELDKASNQSAVADDDFKQLVKFTISKGTELEEVITAEDATSGKEIVSSKLYNYATVNPDTPLSYTKTGSKLGSVYIGNASFIINVSDPSKYKIMKLSDFKGNTSYKVGVFDVTTTDSAKAIVVYDGTTNIGKLTGASPVVLVDDIQQTGESYVIYDKEGNSYVLSKDDADTNTVAATIEQGDIVRLGGSDGEYTLKPTYGDDAGYIVFDLSASPTGIYRSENNDNGSVAYKAIWGSVYKKYDGERLILSRTVLEGWDGTTGERPTVSVTEEAMEKSWFSGAKIYRINKNSRTPIEDITSDGYENILEGLQHYDNTGATIARPAEVFIHMTSGSSVKMMVIIER